MHHKGEKAVLKLLGGTYETSHNSQLQILVLKVLQIQIVCFYQ